MFHLHEEVGTWKDVIQGLMVEGENLVGRPVRKDMASAGLFHHILCFSSVLVRSYVLNRNMKHRRRYIYIYSRAHIHMYMFFILLSPDMVYYCFTVVFVGNLSYDTTEEELRDHLTAHDTPGVESVQVYSVKCSITLNGWCYFLSL